MIQLWVQNKWQSLLNVACAGGCGVAFVLAFGSPCGAAAPPPPPRTELFAINYSKVLNVRDLAAYDFSIISPYADIDLAEGHRLGGRFHAYISVGEIAPDAPYRTNALQKKIKFMERNETWRSDVVDLSQTNWTEFVSELGAAAAAKGFDGFFLDTLDAVEVLAQKNPASAAAYRAGLVRLVKRLRQEHPERKIIVNRGFAVLDQLTNTVNGVLVESLFQTYDSSKEKYVPVAPGTTAELLRKMTALRAAGLPVYVVDYADAQEKKLVEATARKIADLGFHPLVTTFDLLGPSLAPLVPKPRFLMNIFGNQVLDFANRIQWPADSFSARGSQVVLEWLGYELDYVNVVTEDPPATLSAKYCGIIIDRFLEIPPEKEAALTSWLLKHQSRGVKLIFLGEIPIEQDEHRSRLLKSLGISGSGNVVGSVEKVAAKSLEDPLLSFETKVPVLPTSFRDLVAPSEAALHLSLTAERKGRTYRFDPVFTTSWGGCALDPFLTFQRPDFCELWVVDPFQFFARALQTEQSPVPDPSTRAGLRVFYSHIDGDGFANKSVVEPGKRSSEVIRDHIIKKYSYPMTCSIIESELLGRVVGQEPGDKKLLPDIARSIFALPHVQAGSHTYTHPFYWIANDRTSVNYEGQNLELVAPYDKEVLDLNREIMGSVRYINESLLPPDKRVSVFLWSGNCRPGPEALQLTRQLGIENLNGGDTLISERFPTLTAVAPRAMPWRDQLQIYASNQNENEFNNNWSGPFYGGFIHTIEVFKRTDLPRRLKPMNIYFHMYSGDYHDSLRVLAAVYDYVDTQPVHALTVSQFAGTIRDSRETRVFRLSNDHWILSNRGHMATFRLDGPGRFPDLARSKGVTGFTRRDDFLYLHTDGSPKVELVLSSEAPTQPYLVSSTAEIVFEQLGNDGIAFRATDIRAVTVELGGLRPSARLNAFVNDLPTSLSTDAQGRIALRLPAQARVLVPQPRQTQS